jgi:hypothetical protein
MNNLAVCGLICEECEFFEETCSGCYKIKGKTFWAQETLPKKVCPIFDCAVNDKEYQNCGLCSDLPCKIFHDLRDPNISDEEHEKSIFKRISRFRSK